MNRILLLPAVFLLLAAGSARCQEQEEAPPAVAPPHRILLQLEERSPDEMDAADRQVIRGRQQDLNAAVTASGYDLQAGEWSQVQAVCPVIHGALLLRFNSDSGTKYSSRFVAVVPRGTGEVRVVPVSRGGNS